MTIWLNDYRSPAIAVWITATFGQIHQRSAVFFDCIGYCTATAIQL
jgi:hypothetical protein